MIMNRIPAQPNKWTFLIPPIAKLLARYVKNGKGWIDPFAGKNSPAEITNDHNKKMPTKYHMDAQDFCKMLKGKYEGVLFDPPYSYRQITEHYQAMGLKASQMDTSSNFYGRVRNAICDKIKVGGLAISFGWDSNGFGKSRGYLVEEILLVPHGDHHHDTICTVERKIQSTLF